MALPLVRPQAGGGGRSPPRSSCCSPAAALIHRLSHLFVGLVKAPNSKRCLGSLQASSTAAPEGRGATLTMVPVTGTEPLGPAGAGTSCGPSTDFREGLARLELLLWVPVPIPSCAICLSFTAATPRRLSPPTSSEDMHFNSELVKNLGGMPQNPAQELLLH